MSIVRNDGPKMFFDVLMEALIAFLMSEVWHGKAADQAAFPEEDGKPLGLRRCPIFLELLKFLADFVAFSKILSEEFLVGLEFMHRISCR